MDETAASRAEFRVVGRVQGVGFRWWTVRQARSLGLRGTVRNLPDGSVEIRAVGPGPAITRFEEALREGPPGARVDDVRRSQPPAGRFEPPADFRAVH